MELNIGTNVYRNTNGVLIVHGKEQLVLQIQPENHQLCLTMDFYDATGTQIGHVRRNIVAFDSENRFELSASPASLPLFTSPSWLKVLDKTTGETVLEATLTEHEQIHIVQGKFYSHKGQLIEITPNYCRIPGNPATFGNVVDVHGNPVLLE